MKRLAAIALVLAGALPAAAADSVWEIDPVHTSVGFSVRHMMVSNVRGVFRKVSGTARGDESNPTGAVIEATIDAASIDTGEAKRDEHLRSPDFLDAAKFPTITFTSKRIEKAGDGRYKLIGDLTLHGVTRKIELDVEGPTPAVKNPQGGLRAGAHLTTRINRHDFGITWSKTLEGGGLLVGNEIAIVIDVEAVRK